MLLDDSEKTFWQHADDLRRVLIRVGMIVAVGIGLSMAFFDPLFTLLTAPLNQASVPSSTKGTPALQHLNLKWERVVNTSSHAILYKLPKDGIVGATSVDLQKQSDTQYLIPSGGYVDIATTLPNNKTRLMVLGPAEGFLTALKVGFWVGLVTTSPIWMWIILRFIAPAFRVRERQLMFPFFLCALLFVFLGLLFAYLVTIPLSNQYLYAFNSHVGDNLWTLSQYLDYTVVLLLANGLAFGLCVVLLFLVHLGLFSGSWLATKRRHAILLAFILGALLTPPDVLSQAMLAIPLIALYEVAIQYGKFRERSQKVVESKC